jgi:hypothetical protein
MDTSFGITAARLRATAISTLGMLSAAISLAQTAPSDSSYSVVDRGGFYRVLQRTIAVTNSSTGEISQQVQGYTELGNGMNYLSNGVWVEAQDVIEATPTGAAAVYGQMTATFSGDITSIGAISLTTDTELYQSHPVGLFYSDSNSGKVAQIATVRSSVGTLYPPNVVVFSNVLSGLNADLMLVWTKQGYEQNLVLKQSPPSPSSFGLSSDTTALQLWSAMDSCPAPKEQRPVVLGSGLVDHILIFGSTWFPVGAAFSFGDTPLQPAGQAAQIHVIRPSEPGTVPVAKSLVDIAGQQVLIEEVRYSDLASALSQLPQASISLEKSQSVKLAARGRFLSPHAASRSTRGSPLRVATGKYNPRGVVLDYTILSGTASSYTFSSGTYYIPSSFYVGPNSVTFQANAYVKFGGTWLLAYGPLSFPSSGQVVFTSKDDNLYGSTITNSTANPQQVASEALWIYYPTFSTTVQNALFRWASTGIEYDENAGDHYGHTLSSSVFQDCNIGVNMSMQSDTLTLSSDSYCNVVTPVQTDQYHGTVSGSMTYDCGVVSVAMVNDPNRDLSGLDTNKSSQTECSFAVLDSSTIVAAFMNTHLSEYELAGSFPSFPGIPSPRMTSWAISTNGGGTFADKGPILPISTVTNGSIVITNGASDPMHGDAGDTTMAYDSRSNVVYLLINSSREQTNWYGFRLWASTDKGQSFNPINMDVPGVDVHGSHLVNEGDKPMVKVSQTNLYVAGTQSVGPYVWAAHSSNGGTNWGSFTNLDSVSGDVRGADIAVVPDGTVYVFWLRTWGTTNQFRYAYFSTNNVWSSTANIGPQLTATNAYNGSGNPLRYNGTNDYFIDNAFPHVTYANGCIYIVYADVPSLTNTTDRGDIFLIEAQVVWTNHALSVTAGPRKVNNDGTQTDQWDPSISSNPSGTELFIGYYSRQNDPVTNSWIKAYGAKAYITNGLNAATFECIPIAPTSFQPLFAGTSVPPTNTWAFDPVWPPGNVCLDTNAVADGQQGSNPTQCPAWPNNGGDGFTTSSEYATFRADDYTWSASDSSYFYFAWSDCSRTNGTVLKGRPDPDVKFAKIKQ